MKYSGPQTKLSRFRRVGRPFLVIAIACVSFSFVYAQTDSPKELKRSLKDAAKLTRAAKLFEAETILRRAADAFPRRSEAKLELAYVLGKQRRLLEGYEIAFDVAKAEPQNAHAFSVLGYILVTAGRFREARPVLAQAVKLDRGEHLAYASFGLLDFYENKIEYSLSNLKSAVFIAPREPDYLFTLAQVSARAEDYAASARHYEEFLHYSSTTDTDRRTRIKGLINFLRYLGTLERLYVPAGKSQSDVPFELVGDRPVISLHVNDKAEPLRFVLDTGSSISVISEEAAKRFKIKPVARGGFAKGIGGDGTFEIIYGLLREVEIGDVNVKNVPIYIRKFHSNTHQIDGYIGLSLISKFLTTIDYGRQTFTLTRKDVDAREFRAGEAMSLPLRLTSSGFLSGEVELEGVESTLNFIVDTGASVSVISERVARIDPVKQYIRDEKLRVIGAAGITDDMPTFMLPRVTFGKNTRRDITAVALDLDIINEASGFEQAGILGGNFLKNYRLTFDFKNSKVVFEPISAEN